jgi:LDH2 family malate/lactate/ureidoglycolate dehydrogenase
MRVSLNEIQVMCRKAFEGMGFAAGDCEDAADMVGWLQLQGLDGVGALENALDYLQGEAHQPFALRYEDSALLVIDAKGQSVLRCAATAVELALGKALNSGQAVLRIHHCHNRLLLLGYLCRAAEQGLDVQARWGDARQVRIASFSAGNSRPELHIDERPCTRDVEQSITVAFSRPSVPARHQVCGQAALAQGFTVSEATWQRLKQLAEQVLVESTEASRRHGAGGGSDAD